MTLTVPERHLDAATRRDQSWVFFNGKICRYADAKIGLLTHALNYGTGCFEGIRAYWNQDQEQLFGLRVPEHYERMRDNARVLQMTLPVSTIDLVEITKDLLRRNEYRGDAYIRPLLFKDAQEIGVRLHDVSESFAICLTAMGEYVPTTGLRCMVSSWRRMSSTMAPPRTKCTGIYINSALAKSEAVQNGFDEAIFLTQEGHVCEGSAENIFLIRGGTFITPPPSDDILEGITRTTVMHLVREELGLDVVERSIDRTELYTADEVFMCGTGAQVAPVVEIDRRKIAAGRPGPLTTRLQQTYLGVCRGENPKYLDWLTPTYSDPDRAR